MARFPGDAAVAAMFLAVPDGRYLPLPVRGVAEGETIAFDVAFQNPEDLKALKGVTVTVVMAGERGSQRTGSSSTESSGPYRSRINIQDPGSAR